MKISPKPAVVRLKAHLGGLSTGVSGQILSGMSVRIAGSDDFTEFKEFFEKFRLIKYKIYLIPHDPIQPGVVAVNAEWGAGTPGAPSTLLSSYENDSGVQKVQPGNKTIVLDIPYYKSKEIFITDDFDDSTDGPSNLQLSTMVETNSTWNSKTYYWVFAEMLVQGL